MAGLAAAFDLTRTEALQELFDVTIYQLGWRLGGKAASGRLPDGRIVEHGLHVWFGCYENAFELVRAAYSGWHHPNKDQAITEPDKAFERRRFTVLGSGARAVFSGILWPEICGKPGEGRSRLALWPCITQLLEVIKAQYHEFKPDHFSVPAFRIPSNIAVLLAEANVHIDDAPSRPEHARALHVQFEEGLAATQDWAALRLFGSYRDAFAYEPVAGLGEVVVVPIYQALRERGVHFQFFHKLTRIELNQTGDAVALIHFDRQVDLCVETYEPTIGPEAKSHNLEHWPECPRWDQIKDGDALKKLDFESYWCNHSTDKPALRQGEDFDEVVLAIPVGAFKRLNAAPGPCAELIAASTRFKKMTDAASLVPTISVQAWCVPSLAELGWPPQGLASVGTNDYPLSCGPPPLSIWADRTVVLDYEHWPNRPPPASLQYLCDAFETSLYKEPPECAETPHKAHRHALRLAVEWLEERSRVLWPAASPSDVFDWNVLYDPEGRSGADRIYYQVVKANVDPSACCTGSPAGSTRWRLRADRSGFAHLFLAGSWIDTGFNVESIETAVISGRQAARAIIGAREVIYGEDFLHFERGLSGWIRELALGAEAVAETIFGLASGTGGPYARRGAGRRRQGGGRP
jgi:uncharacterized protein with NAD-binding domain and iron-sulfur cluster